MTTETQKPQHKTAAKSNKRGGRLQAASRNPARNDGDHADVDDLNPDDFPLIRVTRTEDGKFIFADEESLQISERVRREHEARGDTGCRRFRVQFVN